MPSCPFVHQILHSKGQKVPKSGAFKNEGIHEGGPNKYTGKDMREAHKRLVAKGLNDMHVDAVIENLSGTLRQLGVGEKDVLEVAALANSVRNDVLNR